MSISEIVFQPLHRDTVKLNVAVSLVSLLQVHFNEVCVAEGVVGGSPLCLFSVFV